MSIENIADHFKKGYVKGQLDLLEQLRQSAEEFGGALIITANGWDYVDNHVCFPNEDMAELMQRSRQAVALHKDGIEEGI